MSMSIEPHHELHGRRRGRNVGVMVVLLAFVALLFAVSVVKLGTNAKNPSAGKSWSETLQKWVTE